MGKKKPLYIVDNGDVQDRFGLHRQMTKEQIASGRRAGWLKKDAEIRPKKTKRG